MIDKEEFKKKVMLAIQYGVMYGTAPEERDNGALKQLTKYTENVMSMIDELYAQHTQKEQQ